MRNIKIIVACLMLFACKSVERKHIEKDRENLFVGGEVSIKDSAGVTHNFGGGRMITEEGVNLYEIKENDTVSIHYYDPINKEIKFVYKSHKWHYLDK